MRPWKAIAAMSLNRVIGSGNKIPWHLPEDFKWFKKRTLGNILVMGRKTFESLGRPLPGRITVVLSRSGFSFPGIVVKTRLDDLDFSGQDRDVFVCGGSEIYAQALPRCSDLYLTLVKRVVEGDAFFPPFEGQFEMVEEITDGLEFKIIHYRNRILEFSQVKRF